VLNAPIGQTSQCAARGSDHRPAIGFLGDFSLPFVTDLIVGLARHREPAKFDMIVYSISPLNSALRGQLEVLGARVISIAALSELRAAQMIRDDQIDVLVEACSFGFYAKPGIFSHRPAKLQIGLPGFTRPGNIGDLDCQLSDTILGLAPNPDSVPPAPLFMGGCAYLISPDVPPAAQALRASPVRGGDGAVFGILASAEHISSRSTDLWKTLAERIPGAAFFICPLDAADIASIRNILIAAGINSSRLHSPPHAASGGHGSALSDLVDVILDTTPGSDYVSVRAALVNGIPIVTMPGRMPVERIGFSILRHLGLASDVAASGRDYVDIAARWATDPDERKRQSVQLGASWREASLVGMPFSIEAYTRRFEAAVSSALAGSTPPTDNAEA
jgi:predicted O-linked N-acetylglucosamine transferase (SPINDLY family)